MKNLQAAPLRARTRRFARRSGGEALGVDVDVAVADLVDVAAQLWPVVAAGDVDGARQRPPGHRTAGQTSRRRPVSRASTLASTAAVRARVCARRRPARPALSRRAAGRGSPPAPPRGRAFRRGRDRRLEQPTGRPSCTRSPERLAWPTSRWPRRRQLVQVPGPRPRPRRLRGPPGRCGAASAYGLRPTLGRPAELVQTVAVGAPRRARPPPRRTPPPP